MTENSRIMVELIPLLLGIHNYCVGDRMINGFGVYKPLV